MVPENVRYNRKGGEMNGRERVMTAIKGGVPDRIPLMELAIDDQVIQQIMPGASQLDFHEKLDLDGIHVFYDVLYEDVGPHIKRDFFGVLRDFRDMEGLFPMPVEPLIKADMNPLKFLEKYRMPDPDDPRILADLGETVKRFKGEKAIVFAVHSCLAYGQFIRGFENLMMDYYENPEFALQLADMISDFFAALGKNAIEMGAEIIVDGDDYAGVNGLLMSIDHIKQFNLPALRKLVKVAHDHGVPFVKHCDGNMMEIVDLLIQEGVDCLNPIEPAPGMDIGQIKQRYGHRVSLWGGIDCTNLLTFGTPELVRAATLECIEKAGPGGGYILSSTNTIHHGVPANNFLAMVDTARKHGNYPVFPCA